MTSYCLFIRQFPTLPSAPIILAEDAVGTANTFQVHKILKYKSQIYKGDPRTCAIFIPAWAQIGGLRVFPVIKITVVHQVCMSPASTVV